MSLPPQRPLRRVISLPWLVLYGLGTTIGAGIYVLTGVVAGRAGMHAPFAFAVASLLALFTALSFAELSSRYPRAGGEAVYVLEGFGSLRLSRLVGLLVVLAGLISAATVCVGLVGYLSALVRVPPALGIALVVLGAGGVAAWGIRQSVALAGLMTLIEIGGLLLVIAAGGEQMWSPPARVAWSVPADAAAWSAVGAAAILCFYAFLGFEDMVSVAEEAIDARHALPRAILATLSITAVLYVVLAGVAVTSVPPAELARSGAPLALIYARGGGRPEILASIAVIALANGGLIQLMKSARMLYGLAREGALPQLLARPLARVSSRTRTPLLATAVVTLTAGIFALSLPLERLARLTSLATLISFTLVNAALLRLKRREPPGADTGAATRLPLWIPAVGFAASLGFVLLELSRPFHGWLP